MMLIHRSAASAKPLEPVLYNTSVAAASGGPSAPLQPRAPSWRLSVTETWQVLQIFPKWKNQPSSALWSPAEWERKVKGPQLRPRDLHLHLEGEKMAAALTGFAMSGFQGAPGTRCIGRETSQVRGFVFCREITGEKQLFPKSWDPRVSSHYSRC